VNNTDTAALSGEDKEIFALSLALQQGQTFSVDDVLEKNPGLVPEHPDTAISRILICGCNGAGKSILGCALAREQGCPFLGIEDYWCKDGDYGQPTPEEEALAADIRRHEHFVLAAVTVRKLPLLYSSIDREELLRASAELRMQRIRQRSLARFGGRVLLGGDLHLREGQFIQRIGQRWEDEVLVWLESFSCPVLELDESSSVEEKVALIRQSL